MSATAPTIRDRVVIVGCGFGGLFAARTLGHADVDVTIGRTNHHLSQALLYQGNTSVVVGEVLDIDVEARRLTIDRLGQCDSIPYDSLIVATGATQSYFGHPEFQHNAPGLKSPALPRGCSGLRSICPGSVASASVSPFCTTGPSPSWVVDARSV